MRGRWLIAFVLTLSASLARADWLIDSPTGRKIPYGTFKLEFDLDAKRGRASDVRFGVGIGKSFDLVVRRSTLEGLTGSSDLTYAYVAPVAGVSPGIAIGVRDLTNQSADGRRAYLAFTLLEDTDTDDGTLLADYSLGINVRQSVSLFVAGATPISKTAKLLAEFDGRHALFGASYDLRRGIATRLIIRERHLMLGLQWTKRL